MVADERWYFMKEKLQRFMWGRYGNDRFNQFLMIVALVCLALFFGSENILCVGSCPVGLCLLPDVFQEYEQEKCGEPMVSQKRNEGAQLVAAPEETFCRTQGL